MKESQDEIYAWMTPLTEGASMSDIQKEFPESKKKTIIRHVKDLVKNGYVKHDRIYGKGKRKRYFVNEENTKNLLLVKAAKVKGETQKEQLLNLERKKYKEVKLPITQRNLSIAITEEINLYKQEMANRNLKPWDDFIFYHIAQITHCLLWISQITWAINSGMLGDSKFNIALAYENRKRYEKFLIEKIIYNLKETHPEIMKALTQAIYHLLTDNQLIREVTIDTNTRKPYLMLNKGKKFKIKL